MLLVEGKGFINPYQYDLGHPPSRTRPTRRCSCCGCAIPSVLGLKTGARARALVCGARRRHDRRRRARRSRDVRPPRRDHRRRRSPRSTRTCSPTTGSSRARRWRSSPSRSPSGWRTAIWHRPSMLERGLGRRRLRPRDAVALRARVARPAALPPLGARHEAGRRAHPLEVVRRGCRRARDRRRPVGRVQPHPLRPTRFLSDNFGYTLLTATCDNTYYGTGHRVLGLRLRAATTTTRSTRPSTTALVNEVEFRDRAVDYIKAHKRPVPGRDARALGAVHRRSGTSRTTSTRSTRTRTSRVGRAFVAWGGAIGWFDHAALRDLRARGDVATTHHAHPRPSRPYVAVLIAVTLTFYMNRYRASTEACLCLLAAVGIDALWTRLRRGALAIRPPTPRRLARAAPRKLHRHHLRNNVPVMRNDVLDPAAGSSVVDDLAERAVADRRAAYADEVRRLIDAAFVVMRAHRRRSTRGSRDIVQEAGLSNQAFYRHFASKDALLLAVLADGQRQLVAHLAARGSRASRPGATQVRALDRRRAGAGARRRRGRGDPPVRDQRRPARRPLPRRVAASRARAARAAARRRSPTLGGDPTATPSSIHDLAIGAHERRARSAARARPRARSSTWCEFCLTRASEVADGT